MLPQGTIITKEEESSHVGRRGNTSWIILELPWGDIQRENPEIKAKGFYLNCGSGIATEKDQDMT